MSSIGKKILAAFVDVSNDTTTPVVHPPVAVPAATPNKAVSDSRFQQHFEKLFSEANLPGPDYYEFSKMIAAMRSITDEAARYNAAFAGLQVQGLNKEQLLATAAQYMQLLERDATDFQATIDVAMQEKVAAQQQELEGKKTRIQQLSQEIAQLHQEIGQLNSIIQENEEKIRSSSTAYQVTLTQVRNTMLYDIEKIKQHIL